MDVHVKINQIGFLSSQYFGFHEVKWPSLSDHCIRIETCTLLCDTSYYALKPVLYDAIQVILLLICITSRLLLSNYFRSLALYLFDNVVFWRQSYKKYT